MAWFRNYYRCARCQHSWTDEWSAMCDDDCRRCGARHMTPVKSDDLTVVMEEKANGSFSVLRSPETAEHSPDYREVSAFPTRDEAQAFVNEGGLSERSGNRKPLALATKRQAIELQIAIGKLKDARDHLKKAGCPSTLRKVRSALKSAEGAERHMARRLAAGSAP